MKMRTQGIRMGVVLALVGPGCTPGDRGSPESGSADTTTVVSRVVAGVESLAASADGDTISLIATDSVRIYVVNADNEARIVWQEEERGRWREVWRSRDLLGALPQVVMEDLDGNGQRDLFWSIAHEDLIGGMVVLQRNEEVVELSPDVVHCERPEIRRIDGSYLFVAYGPGALPAGECRDPVVVTYCVEEFQISWPRFFALGDMRLTETNRERRYYADLAMRYRRDAARLDSMITLQASLPEMERSVWHCGTEAANRMVRLADSAAALATSR